MIDKAHNFIAIDLGASNGRIVRGRLYKGKLEISIIHRFEHSPQTDEGHLCWRWGFITDSVKRGLYKAAESVGKETIESLSCTSWAQDFGFLDKISVVILFRHVTSAPPL